MTLVDVLKRYQGGRSLRRYATALGIDAATLSRVYTGKRPAPARLLWALLRTYPEAADDLAVAAAFRAEKVA
jgi:transcriptional regulator with XRE-family HTH domain